MPEKEPLTPREEKVEYNTLNMVYLMFAEKPQLPQAQAVKDRLNEVIGGVDVMAEKEEMRSFLFQKFPSQFKEGTVPSQVAMFGLDKLPDLDMPMIRSQTRRCDPEAALDQFRHAVLVSEFMASGQPREKRAELFGHTLQIFLEFFPDCCGILLPHSQQIMLPDDFIDSNPWSGESYNPLFGMVNVRVFHLKGLDRILMDTVGMHVFGLPDAQCCFQGRPVDQMALLLYRFANALFRTGDTLENGACVGGGAENEKWECNHREAMVPPHRVVVDLSPAQDS